jgi:hypothetical protein
MPRRRIPLDEVERRVDAVRLRPPFGYIGVNTSVRELREKAGVKASVTGCISMQNWNMELGVNTKWRPEEDTLIKEFLAARSVSGEGVFVIAEDAGRHEFGHPKYCPMSLESYTFIKSAVAEELVKQGINSRHAVDYVSNAFMDWIDNANVRAGGNGNGLSIFYYTQGDSDFFSSFIALNILTWGDEADRLLLGTKFMENMGEKKMKEVVGTASNFLLQLGLVERLPNGEIREKTMEQKMKVLNDSERWEDMARRFVKAFAKSMRFNKDQPQPGQQPQQGQQGGQQQKQGQQQKGQPKQQGQKGQKGEGQQEGEGKDKGKKKGGKQKGDGEQGEEGESQEGQGKGR